MLKLKASNLLFNKAISCCEFTLNPPFHWSSGLLKWVGLINSFSRDRILATSLVLNQVLLQARPKFDAVILPARV